MSKTWIIILSLLGAGILIAAWYYLIYKPNNQLPGVGKPYKCNQTGDDTEIYFGKNGQPDNWKARGAVCDGLFIPNGSNLFGQDTTRVLEWMGEIYTNHPTWAATIDYKANPNINNLQKLAEAAAYQASKNP